MPETPRGLYYPPETGQLPDVPADLKRHGESVEALLTATKGKVLIAQNTGAAAFKALKGDATLAEDGTLQNAVVRAAALGRGATQELADSTETTIGFTEKIFDTDGMWSEAAKEKLTIKTSGLFWMGFSLTSFTEGIEDGYAYIKRSTITAAFGTFGRKTPGGVEWLCSGSTIEYLEAGETLELRCALNTTGAKASIFNFGGHTPVMRVARLGRIA